MKSSAYLSVLLLMISIVHGYSQDTRIQGQVIDKESREFLAGAIVTRHPGNEMTITDLSGRYSFENRAGVNDTVDIHLFGYESLTYIFDESAVTLPAVHKLEAGVFNLEQVQITADPELQATSISAVDIQLRNISTSQDILRMVPGLFIAQHAGGGKAEQIFLRGFDIDHGTDISITTDGMPVNMVSHAHGQGYADLHYLIPETVDRVHFGKGPYHTHHGNMATAGFVGFNTYNALPESKVTLQYGQFNSRRVLGMVNLLDNHHDFSHQNAYIAAEVYGSDGYFESPQGFTRKSVFGKYNTNVGRSSYLVTSLSTFSSSWDASGQIPSRAVASGQIGYFGAIDDTEGGSTSRSNLNLQMMTTLNPKSLLKNQLFLTHYTFELYSNFTFFLEDPEFGDQIKQKENRILAGYNGIYTHEGSFLNKQLRTEMGIQIRYDYSRDNELSHTFNKTQILDRLAFGNVMEANAGLYVNETMQFGSRFTVNAGLRFDHFDFGYTDFITGQPKKQIADNIISPKLNAYYKLSDQIQIAGNMGYGFHSNDSRVVVAQDAFRTLPRALGTDIGIVVKPSKRLLLSATAWRLALDQEFVYVGDAAIVEPSGRTLRMGTEFSGRWQMLEWLFADIDLNYTFARARDEARGQDYIPLAPLFSSIGGITVKTNEHWSGSLRFRSLGDRPANEDNTVVARGYSVFDCMLQYKVKKYEFGLNIENIFDVRWKEAQFDTESRLKSETESVSEIHFTPGTPFNVRAFVSYTF